ncbi:hypothetical protein HELRODRAFT_158961 [Helobdella robusta]|uniref:Integrin alpha-2 domain-containing protein n=1 Tax=Helobdella robusta TaxID=6412 RepID=T1ENF7_HELRO|nr:hypothetical protein HELRODRAFT_158961 [Helobdella robusta]ESO12429.1 hypothetical protein HELRODRAFT_158961 [Helobdella robusta]
MILFNVSNIIFIEVLDKRGSCHYPSHIVDTLKLNPDRTKLVDKSDEQLYDKSSTLPECQAVHNIQPFCEIINCQINSLEPSESSVIKIRTSFSAVMKRPKYQYIPALQIRVSIKSTSQMMPQRSFFQHFVVKSQFFLYIALTVELMKAELKEKVSWWIYAVAGAAGFLMLCLMVLCLWKCGFFKRKKYEHLVTVTKKEEFEDDSKKAPSSLTS